MSGGIGEQQLSQKLKDTLKVHHGDTEPTSESAVVWLQTGLGEYPTPEEKPEV